MQKNFYLKLLSSIKWILNAAHGIKSSFNGKREEQEEIAKLVLLITDVVSYMRLHQQTILYVSIAKNVRKSSRVC